jgi:hypothetical protein
MRRIPAFFLQLRSLLLALVLAFALPTHALTPLPDVAMAEQATRELKLDVALHEVDEARRRPLEKITRQALSAVQSDLQTKLVGELHVDFVGSPESFAAVMTEHGASGWPESWISGLAILDQDRIIVQVNGPGALLTGETVRHELAHVAIHALTAGKTSLPRWYHEGVATWLAGEDVSERLREGLPELDARGTLAQLNKRFSDSHKTVQTAYATAASFVRFALKRGGGAHALLNLHARMRAGLEFSPAFTATFGMDPEALYELYGAMTTTPDPSWLKLFGENTLWPFASVLAALGLLWRMWRRPRLVTDHGPLDLEEIAHAGDLAVRPWRRPGFRMPVAPVEEPPGEAPEAERADHQEVVDTSSAADL